MECFQIYFLALGRFLRNTLLAFPFYEFPHETVK